MRDVDSSLITALDGPREIALSATVRQRRIILDDPILIEDSLGLSDPSRADLCDYSTGFLRVVNFMDGLYVQEVLNIEGPPIFPWPAWEDCSVALKSESRPGIQAARLWYQKADGDIAYRDWTGSLGPETVVTSAYADYTCVLAPVSASVCFVHYQDGTYGAVAKLESGEDPIDWPGRIYGDIQTADYFDAVQGADGRHYLYLEDKNDGRILELISDGAQWSQLEYVIPIDVVDDSSFLRLAHATLLGDQVFLTTRLSRPNEYEDIAFDAFLMGPHPFSMGREIFLTQAWVGGHLLVKGDSLYYIGVNSLRIAPATVLVGVDNADLKSEITSLSDLSWSEAMQTPFQAQIGVAVPLNEPLLTNGNELILEAGYNDVLARIASTLVVGYPSGSNQTGRERGARSVGLALGGLTQWVPDQDFNISSPSMMAAAPAELDEMIRTAGTFGDDDNILTNTKLNDMGVLYSSAYASRGGLMRARFKEPSGQGEHFKPEYGVGINYYMETRGEAALRLGVQIEDLNPSLVGHNAILAIYGPDQHEGGSGIGLYLWRYGELTLLTSASCSFAQDEWVWMQIYFVDGHIRVDTRDDIAWVNQIDTIYNNQDFLPWPNDTYGRGCLYLNNVTTHSASYGLYMEDVRLGLDDNSVFPSSGTIIVDEEQITYDGKTTNTPLEAGADLTVVAQFAFRNDDKASFAGFPIVLETADSNPSVNKNTYDDYACVVVDGPGKGKSFTVSDYDCVAPQVWVPTGTYTPPDKWQNHVGQSGKGSWEASNMRRVFVSEDPSSIIGEGSVVKVLPALKITGRGANSTQATTHEEATAGIFIDASVQVDLSASLSQETPKRLGDLARHIARLGGVMGFVGDDDQGETITFPDSGWNMSTWHGRSEDRVMLFDVPTDLADGDEAGVAFRLPEEPEDVGEDGPATTEGYMITVAFDDPDYVLRFYVNDGDAWVLEEELPLWLPAHGQVRVMIHGEFFGVWIADRLVHLFTHAGWATGKFVAYVRKGAGDMDVELSAVDDFIEDFILERSKNGFDTLMTLVDIRPIYISETAEGDLRVFRRRTDIGTLPDILVELTANPNEAQAPTRVRAEGGEVAEIVDYEQLAQQGNLFTMLNATLANTAEQAAVYARERLNEFRSFSNPLTFVGGLDFRVQAGDEAAVLIDGAPVEIIIDAIGGTINSTMQDAAADMQVQARQRVE